MKIQQETITPAKAEEYLGSMRTNRPERPKWVRELTKRITNGEWDGNNPNPISFAGEKTLIDGQHRLMACVEANKSIRCWVARDVPSSTVANIDTGKARTMMDLLRMRGEQNTAAVAAALRQVLKYRATGQVGGRGGEDPSHAEMLETLDKEPQFREVIRAVGDLRNMRLGIGPGTWGALWIIFSEKDEGDADQFFELMKTGEDLQDGDPILALRKTLLNQQYPRPQRINAALVIKGWNAFRQGERMQAISWKAGGKKPEPYPEVR